MTEHDQVEIRLGLRQTRRGFAEATSTVLRDVCSARVRAIRRQRRREIRVQPPKRTNGQAVSKDVTNRAVFAILQRPQPIAMLEMHAPAGDVVDQRTELVVDADVFAQNVTTPAVVVAGDHSNRHAGVDDVGQRGQCAKAATRDDRAPLEPELEEIAVDHQRTRSLGDVTKKRDDGPFDIAGPVAQMCVGHDVARRFEHARILPSHLSLYKPIDPDDLRRVTNETPSASADAATGPLHHDVEFRVRYAETDQMGVVYHANYLIWCEVGRTDFIRARGMSYAEMERAGVALAVSELSARFHGAARYDDMIRVRTTLAEVRSRGIVFDYLITDVTTGRRLVTARTALVSLDSSGRPTAFPSAVRALFQQA
jgi:acyl-CoA thioester hydrolase